MEPINQVNNQHVPNRKRSFTLAFKLEVIKALEQQDHNNDKSATARAFKLSRQSVQQFVRQKSKLEQFRGNPIWSRGKNTNQFLVGSIFSKQSILVMDAHSVHITRKLTSSFARYSNTSVCIIPGGLTSLLQVLDVYINKSFKASLKKHYKNWLENDTPQLTKSGNRKKAGYVEIAQWVMAAWSECEKEMIKKGFTGCGQDFDRKQDEMHSRLRKYLCGNDQDGYIFPEDHSGLTDDEQDDSEVFEHVELANESDSE